MASRARPVKLSPRLRPVLSVLFPVLVSFFHDYTPERSCFYADCTGFFFHNFHL